MGSAEGKVHGVAEHCVWGLSATDASTSVWRFSAVLAQPEKCADLCGKCGKGRGEAHLRRTRCVDSA